MDSTAKDVIQFVLENDVKFIRLAFCDLNGVHKNISIMPSELENAFENGVAFDANAVDGFGEYAKDDLFLFPIASTLNILPWRPQQGRVVRFFCKILTKDKAPFLFDGVEILQKAVKRCRDMDLEARFATKSEFYLFKTDDDGYPTKATLDEGGYFDISPLDKGENVRRDICLCLEKMGILPTSSHHEMGPGQNEIDFRSDSPMTCAENFLTYKSVVKAIGAQNGLFASFMPKPFDNKSGSGLHIDISISKHNKNIFDKNEKDLKPLAEGFMEGILSHTNDITAFLNPTINSYMRFGSFEAPTALSWSYSKKDNLLRLIDDEADFSKIDFRSPDGTINPYIAFALIISAGLDGIQEKMTLREKDTKTNSLPKTLEEAVKIMKASDFTKKILGESLVNTYSLIKEREIEKFNSLSDEKKEDFIARKYFNVL